MVIDCPQIAIFVTPSRRDIVRDILSNSPSQYQFHDIADLAALQAGQPSAHCRAIIAEAGSGSTAPLDLIAACVQVAPGLPLIIISEESDPVLAQECLAQGAADFIHFSWLFRLPYALENAIMRYDEQLRNFETEALQRANAALANLSRRKDEFLANVSHELRTPLNNILLAAQMMETGLYGQLAEKQSRAIENIVTSGNHLLNLINDILDLARIESGNVELEMGQVSLHRLAETSRSLLHETAHHKGVQMHVTVDSTIDFVHGDYRRLLQIVVNLLGNAVKFTPAGRDVGLAIQSDEVDR
ncbi:MAG: hypothetical protein KDE59_18625, partial [Anaerolineales bacterium]|nr:hypothetical protein [Anaerolineales bacterium]